MTLEELKSLGKHDKVKYVGVRPLSDVFGGWTYDYTAGYSSKATVWKPAEEKHIPKNVRSAVIVSGTYAGDKQGVTICFWKGPSVTSAISSEWDLVEKRGWVEKETEYKRAKAYVPFLIKDFKKKLARFLHSYKYRADAKLGTLPVDKKLRAVMELSAEDKMWFSILSSAPEEALAALERSFKEETNDPGTQ